ncbi:MAG: HTH-type transcriptional regulator, sugar sensing transcriptional regulator [Patescibacteria group bacterium]|nr:hypothetical protein [Candidatus Saccharibacteria bacterium]MDQ5963507.1 HTH-type transcriptional regulator, sugar sensing transcriptional regulator [Patescibacteria group bacterium]
MLDFGLIGLENRDRRVYEALLTLPRSSVRKIAEQTGINRGSVFESIKALTVVGLVAHVEEGKRRRYVAQSPELLHEVIAERRRDLRILQSEVDAYVASLAPPIETVDDRQFAMFYEGDEGLATILRDVLSTCRQQGVSEYCVMPSERVSAYLYTNFPHYTQERINQGLFVRSLRLSGKPIQAAELSEARILKAPRDTGCYSIVYGSKVATISVDTFNVASGIVVDNEGVAAAQQALFDAAWEVSAE